MKIKKTITLEVDDLRLRIPSLGDIPEIFEATKYPGFNDGMGWDAPNSPEELIKPYYNAIKAWEEGKAYVFSIEQFESSKLLGRISIRQTKEIGRWNVGFWTHPKHQNKGIMTKALSRVLSFGFDHLDAIVIEAYHALWNVGSEMVLKKNRMKFIKYVKKGFKKKGEWVEENLLAIERSEWENYKL